MNGGSGRSLRQIIAGFANRADQILLRRLGRGAASVTGQSREGLVERRPDEIVHGRIDDGEMLRRRRLAKITFETRMPALAAIIRPGSKTSLRPRSPRVRCTSLRIRPGWGGMSLVPR